MVSLGFSSELGSERLALSFSSAAAVESFSDPITLIIHCCDYIRCDVFPHIPLPMDIANQDKRQLKVFLMQRILDTTKYIGNLKDSPITILGLTMCSEKTIIF